MIQTVVDVIMSNIALRPIPGNLEIISLYHMVLVVFLPLAFVERQHEHISVDLIYQMMPRWLQRCVLVGGYVIAASFFALLAWQTGIDAWRSYQVKEMMIGAVYLTIWPAKFALPIGFVATFLMVLVNAYKVIIDPNFEPSPSSVENS